MSQVNTSIIVPIFNVQDYLRECLESLVNQNYEDFEIILINDGSTDNSYSICKEYQQKYNFVELYSQENKGLSAARNKGLELAKGKYILFVDSDDYVSLDLCRLTNQYMAKHDVDVVVFKYYLLFDEQQYIPKSIHKEKFFNRVLTQKEIFDAHFSGVSSFISCNKLYKKDFFLNNNLKYPEGRLYEDGITTFKYYLNCRTAYISEDYLYYYRKDRLGSISGDELYSPHNISEKCDLYTEQALVMLKQSSDIISEENKLKYFYGLFQMLINSFASYQVLAIGGQVLMRKNMTDKQYFLFGASAAGEKCYKGLKFLAHNITFVDNDINKENTQFWGRNVISADTLKKIYDKKEDTIIISTVYFLEVYWQLKKMEIIDGLEEIMPFRGETIIEKEYIKGLNKIISIYAELLEKQEANYNV